MITGTTAGFYLLSGIVLVDMWLSLFSIGAVFWYYAFVNEENRRIKKRFSFLVFIFLAGAFLTKGPVGIIFFGLPVFFWTLLSNRWDTLKDHAWITGLGAFVLLVSPWFVLAEKELTVQAFMLKHKSIQGYLHYFFVVENFERFVSPDKSGDLYSGISHAVPKGTAILYSLIVCLPWALIQLFVYSSNKSSNTAMFSAIKQGILNIKGNWFDKSKPDFDMFLIGLISITLFWCVSSHLMLYYMILVTPLFSVWCATVLDRCNFTFSKIANIAGIILILYSLGTIPAYFILDSQKSTKSITLKAKKIREEKSLKGHLVFIRRMKYSTYFYGGGLFVPHGKEPVEESFLHSSEKGDIYIMKTKYLKRIPDSMKNRFHLEYKDKNWAILSTDTLKKDHLHNEK
jgi:4-amino-4-deoxy-L-arabinose transferase-like glycosyltransferase